MADALAYWLSTPRFTVLVEVVDGRIARTAPILVRTWRGRPWEALLRPMQQRYGAACAVELLPMVLGPP
jgi:hypothetical protein